MFNKAVNNIIEYALARKIRAGSLTEAKSTKIISGYLYLINKPT